ncbi:alpha-hydroxy acid oxidase [Asticcacaulis tiandongensis]|uniref:alpha-hydroxy acid oxidase n=1 Tax=Asticcacaulis tiandongensis TaxID=2565365 RepID=UPI0011262F3E|nr:alpha-hydroxy acid oxidase [Asticcacaulis tiandongensis]
MSLSPVLTAIPRDIVSVNDYGPYARERLTPMAWDYLVSGAGDEGTLSENMSAFGRIRLKGRVLGDVRGGHTRFELFGQACAHPILLAPLAYQKLFHADGEMATALAAKVTDTVMVVSTLSTTPLEDVAGVHDALWFQLYLQSDRAVSRDLIRRAEAAGYKALVVTVDAAMGGIRSREQRAGFHLPEPLRAVNLPQQPTPLPPLAAGQSAVFDGLMAVAPTWADIDWVLSETHLPVIIKGILAPEDAVRACQAGVAGIIVSNHGGRVIDTLPASIEALPGVVAAVDGRVPVLLDGGVRRGTDVFKALALGAKAVLVGRPYVQALSAAGALGVAHALRTLREELEIVMALSGCPTVESIGREHLF